MIRPTSYLSTLTLVSRTVLTLDSKQVFNPIKHHVSTVLSASDVESLWGGCSDTSNYIHMWIMGTRYLNVRKGNYNYEKHMRRNPMGLVLT